MVNKSLKLLLAAVVLTIPTTFLYAQEAGVKCLGNGLMAAYEREADVIQLFGPSYSTPSVMKITLDSTIEVESKRAPNTAIWRHKLTRGSRQIAIITDFMDAEQPCFVRRIDAADSFSMTIATPKNDTLQDLYRTPAGAYFYNTYPEPEEVRYQLTLAGSAVKQHGRILVSKGQTTLLVTGGPSYPELITNTEAVIRIGADSMQLRTTAYWQKFSQRRKPFASTIPAKVPDREKLLQTIDDVSILLKTQQSRQGGVLAGHYYHMAYVRDQYGVSRALLKLGYYEEARAILEFYWHYFERTGAIHNAQGMGVEAFHIHENDDVEITGYLLIQAFDYLKATRDNTFIERIFPMLEWAYHRQSKNLIKYMLPFNGDETYVAGGILPRNTLLDGSAEATLLFITGGDRLTEWAAKNSRWIQDSIHTARSLLTNLRQHYRNNFIVNDSLMTNNPERMNGEPYPLFRHGVCEAMGKPPCEFFGWTRKTDSNRYLCPVCYNTVHLPVIPPHRYNLQSVSLTPFYIGATTIPANQVRLLVRTVGENYRLTGNFPSRPGSQGNIVGYDYGLLLYSLVKIDDPLKDEIYSKMMSVLDDTGAWVEYYQDGKPRGTRYRPWESGINLEAALTYAETYR